MALATWCCFSLVGSNQDRCIGNHTSCISPSLVLFPCHVAPSALYNQALTFLCMHPIHDVGCSLGSAFGGHLKEAQPHALGCCSRASPEKSHSTNTHKCPDPHICKFLAADPGNAPCMTSAARHLGIFSPCPWLCWHQLSITCLNFGLCTQTGGAYITGTWGAGDAPTRGQPSTYNSCQVCNKGKLCVKDSLVSQEFLWVLFNCLKSALRSGDKMGYRSTLGYYYYRFPFESPGFSLLEHNICRQLQESSMKLNRTLIMRGSFISPAHAQTSSEADK